MKHPKHIGGFKAVRLGLLTGSIFIMLVSLPVPAQETSKSAERGLTHPESVDALPAHIKRWALLIGIDQYEDSNITPLRGAANDAHSLRETLIKHAGFPSDR